MKIILFSRDQIDHRPQQMAQVFRAIERNGFTFAVNEEFARIVAHTLGRVIWSGSAIPNTGVPGNIGGYTTERVMHSPCGGTFHALRQIGDTVEAGEVVATVGGEPLYAKITGTLRGILPEGFEVPREHFKSADVDPRCQLFHCVTASDKALAVGGGVLEAVLMLTSAVGTARKPEKRGEDYGK